MKFTAKTDQNRSLIVNWDAVNQYLKRWVPGTELEFSLTRKERTVSDPMRRYYWAAVLPVYAEYLGYDKHEHELFHRQLKIVFFSVQPDKKGIHRNIPSVFSNQSEEPISVKVKFISWVIRKAAIDGCIINDPMPNE